MPLSKDFPYSDNDPTSIKAAIDAAKFYNGYIAVNVHTYVKLKTVSYASELAMPFSRQIMPVIGVAVVIDETLADDVMSVRNKRQYS